MYSTLTDADETVIHQQMIRNTANTMTDRCASNHAAVHLIEEDWQKNLNELYCHVHPLDSIASAVRTSLKQNEKTMNFERKVFGYDCASANVILAFNKLRYKMGKGDPTGFILFLHENNLPLLLLPRYRGNRLHIMFHIAGVLYHYHEKFLSFLNQGSECGGLRSSLRADFSLEIVRIELQVIGLLGKLLSGPWMEVMYRSSSNQISYLDAISEIQGVVSVMKAISSPLNLLATKTDFFGRQLNSDDPILKSLQCSPDNQLMFISIMNCSIKAVIDVIERQYKRQFSTPMDHLAQATSTARTHNIDAEEVMGMLSASLIRAPNARTAFISAKIRSQKNKTSEFWQKMEDHEQEKIIKKITLLGRRVRERDARHHKELMSEMLKRRKQKQLAKEQTARNKLERQVKSWSLGNIAENLNVGEDDLQKIDSIRSGLQPGTNLSHRWSEEEGDIVYNGKVEKFTKRTETYVIAYWSPKESYDNAVDYKMKANALVVDFLNNDLYF